MNPIIPLAVAALSWLVILGVNNVWVSAAVFAGAQLFAAWHVRNPSVLASAIVLSIPVGVSMLLVHAAFGQTQLFAFITTEGLSTAAELTLRFVALMSAVLAAATVVTVPSLARALVRYPRLSYIVCSTIHILPRSRDTLAAIRDANFLRGRSTAGPIRAIKYIGLPLITRLLFDGANRAIPLEVAGLDHPPVAQPGHHSLRQICGPSGSGVTRELIRLYESTPSAVMLTADAHAHITYLCATVREELGFGLLQRGISDPERVVNMAHQLGLADLLDRAPNQLSGGQTRRLAIGCVAIIPAPLMLFDAPFAGLDNTSQVAVKNLLNSLDAEVVIGDHQVWFPDEPVAFLGEQLKSVSLPEPVKSSGHFEFQVFGHRGAGKRCWWQFRKPHQRSFCIGPIQYGLPRGGVLWLQGPNGSGKTTLMRALAGLDGANAQDFQVGLMLQDPLDQVIDSTVGSVMPDRSAEHPLDLSARELKLWQFSSVAATQPELLCADEPDVGLDVLGRSQMHHLFAKFLATGGCLVLACHDRSFIAEVEHYAVVIKSTLEPAEHA